MTSVRPRYLAALTVAIGLLLCQHAFATGKPTPETPATPAPSSTSTSGAQAGAVAGAAAGARSDATGGAGGDGGDSSSEASSHSGGNTLSTTTYTPRQTPGMAQGSFAIQGCAVAGNAGGSNVGGTGFLGVAFTTPQCYDFMLAQALQSVGERKASCEVLRESKTGQRAKKRGITITCTDPEPQIVVKEVVKEVPQVCPSQPEREKIILQKCTGK